MSTTAALLAGCGGGAQVAPPVTPAGGFKGLPASALPAQSRGFTPNLTNNRLPKELVYISSSASSGGEAVLAYAKHLGSPIETINGDQSSGGSDYGIAVDPKRNVYVLNWENDCGCAQVLKYKRGSNTPDRIYTQDISGGALYDAVAKDGTLYVSERWGPGGGSSPPEIVVFPPGSNIPSEQLTLPSSTYGYYPTGMAVDKSGNLFVGLTNGGESAGQVLKFAHGSGTPVNLGLRVGAAFGLALDKSGNLLVAEEGQGSSYGIDVFPPGAQQPSKSFQTDIVPFGIALGHGSKELYITDKGNSYVESFSYPGFKLIHKMQQYSTIGVAVSPAQYPSTEW
jgi:hypothetical protein